MADIRLSDPIPVKADSWVDEFNLQTLLLLGMFLLCTFFLFQNGRILLLKLGRKRLD